MLIGALTASFLAGIDANPAVPHEVAQQASVDLAGGIPFLSDAQLDQAPTDAGVSDSTAQAVVDANTSARIDALRISLSVLGLLTLVSLFFTRLLPTRPVGDPDPAQA